MAKKKKKRRRQTDKIQFVGIGKKPPEGKDPAEGAVLSIDSPPIGIPNINQVHAVVQQIDKNTMTKWASPGIGEDRLTSQLRRINQAVSPKDRQQLEQIYQRAANNKETMIRLITQYNEKLIDIGYGMNQEQLDRLDMIDMRTVSENAAARKKISEEIEKRRHAMSMFEHVCWLTPCFTEGVMRTDERRKIHFKVLSADTDTGIIRLSLMDYVLMDHGMGWQCGVSCVVDITCDKNGQSIAIDPENACNYSKIYAMVPKSALPWTKTEYNMWKSAIVQNAITTENALLAQKTHNGYLLTQIFITFTVMANYYLNMEATEPRKAHAQKSSAAPAPHVLLPDKSPKPRIRVIGPVKIKSASAPRTPDSQKLIKYTVPSWSTRGHIRRYKSGKTVYVKPSVHHRKALLETNGETPVQPSIIKIKDET